MNKALTLDDWIDHLDRYGDQPAVISMGKESMRQLEYRDLADLSERLAAGLLDRGIESGDHVALLAAGSPEWVATALGVIRAGAAPVPVDVQFDDESLTHVLKDSQPKYIFADRKRAARLEEFEADLPEVYLLDDEDGEQSWRQFLASESGDLPRPSPGDKAVLFYTSGTTGPPKGVPLTHENIASQIDVVLNGDLVHDQDRILLPLPLHHVYPLVVGLLTPIARGLPVVLPYSLTGPQMVRTLREAEVTFVIGVPRLYRALFEGILARADSGGWIAKKAFHSAFKLCLWLRQRMHVRAGKWLLRPLHRKFGPTLRVVACGGSPLEESLAWNLEALGWQVGIGYGLTETSPLLTINPPKGSKLGSVGRAIRDVELRTQDQDVDESREVEGKKVGEIQARGPSVFEGYLNLPEKTEQAFTEDGWFRSGDLGYLDDEAYLYVTGRKDTLIITESGESVQPHQIESSYAEHPAIREIGVLHQNGQMLALIVPETSEINDDSVREAIAEAVETQAEKLPSYQRLADFHLTREPLPRTRLGKIQRHKLSELLERISSGEEEQAEQQPVALAEMSSEDQALLNDPAARKTWDLLAEKYSQHRLTPDSSMHLDLGMDSLEWMNLSMSIRQEAGVEIDEEAIGRIETVRDLLEEASEASTGEPEDMTSPLADPKAALSEQQQRYLQPQGWVASTSHYGLLKLDGLLMRGFFRLKVRGQEHLPNEPIVIAPNHASYLDAPAIAAAFPWQQLKTTYWAGWTGTMFANPFKRFFSRLMRVVPVDPERAVMSSLAFGAAVLDSDQSLVWFPEGRLSRDGKLQSFQSGIGLLLEKYPVKVVPAAISGTYEALPLGRWFPRFRKIEVTFGPPIDIQSVISEASQDDSEETSRQITRHVHDRLAGILDE